MNLRRVAGAVVGIVLAMLGLLWFLQGTGLVRICPVLCFADCECVEGGSLFWLIAGAITALIGVVLAGVSVRRGRG
jgi:RsiW-degrading membrane proteinase PrsW (M82 family)